MYVADGAASGDWQKLVPEDSLDASAATVGQVLKADGAGAVTWEPAIPQELPHGVISLGGTTNNASATTITALDTYYIVAGTFVEEVAEDITTVGATGRIVVATEGHYELIADLSFIGSRNNNIAAFRFMKNGVAIGPKIRRKMTSASDVGYCGHHWHLAGLVATDYLQIGVTLVTGEGANTAGDSITVENAIFHAHLVELS